MNEATSLYILTNDGRLINDRRKGCVETKKKNHLAYGNFYGEEKKGTDEDLEENNYTFYSLDNNHNKNDTTTTSAATKTTAVTGAIRIDDHRFTEEQQNAFHCVVNETSWFFCSPSTKYQYIQEKHDEKVKNLNNKTSTTSSFRRRNKATSISKGKKSQLDVLSTMLPKLSLYVLEKFTIKRWRKIVKISCGTGHVGMVKNIVLLDVILSPKTDHSSFFFLLSSFFFLLSSFFFILYY
jgi:hypothetical protein